MRFCQEVEALWIRFIAYVSVSHMRVHLHSRKKTFYSNTYGHITKRDRVFYIRFMASIEHIRDIYIYAYIYILEKKHSNSQQHLMCSWQENGCPELKYCFIANKWLYITSSFSRKNMHFLSMQQAIVL
jgi:hypothetical protein